MSLNVTKAPDPQDQNQGQNTQSQGQSSAQPSQPAQPASQGMSSPAGGYPATSSVGKPKTQQGQTGQASGQASGQSSGQSNQPQTPAQGGGQGQGQGQKNSKGGAIREGPNGPEHKHPGYPPGSPAPGKPMKWHNAKQVHGDSKETQSLHMSAGLGKDGLGGNPQMRMSVGAGPEQAPKEPTKMERLQETHPKTAMGVRFAGLAGLGAVQGFGDLAGKSMNAATRFIQSVLSGNPLSPASTMLAETLDGMATAYNSVQSTYDKYGVAMGVDPESIADTIKGKQLKKDLELQSDGHNFAFNTMDRIITNAAGGAGPNGEAPPLESLGANQLEAVRRQMSDECDKLTDAYYRGMADGTLSEDDEKRIVAALEVYQKGFEAIGAQGDANAKMYKEKAKEIRAARSLTKQQEAEAKRQLAEQKRQANEQKMQDAQLNGDYARQVLYQMGEKYYDEELTPKGIPVKDGVRQRYENELEDKIESGNYSPAEVQSMEQRLKECREFGKQKELDTKRRKHEARMTYDYSDPDYDGVEHALVVNNALGTKKVDKHGVVGGDKMTPKLVLDMNDNAKALEGALIRKLMPKAEADVRAELTLMLQNGRLPVTDPVVQRLIDAQTKVRAPKLAMKMAHEDDEWQRVKTAAMVYEWGHNKELLLRQLESNRLNLNYMAQNGLTVADAKEAQQEVMNLFDQYASDHEFMKDQNGEWSHSMPTGAEMQSFADQLNAIREKFGIRKENNLGGYQVGSNAMPPTRRGGGQNPPPGGQNPQNPAPQNPAPQPKAQPKPKQPVLVQVGGRDYTAPQIQKIFGANAAGVPYLQNPTVPQAINALQFAKLNPTFVKEGKDVMNLTAQATRKVLQNYPSMIESLEASGDSQDAAMAREMRKFLNYAQEDYAFRQAAKDVKVNGDEWDLEGLKNAYAEFKSDRARAWTDPNNSPDMSIDLHQGDQDLLEKLKEQYTITPVDVEPVKTDEDTGEDAVEQGENPVEQQEIGENPVETEEIAEENPVQEQKIPEIEPETVENPAEQPVEVQETEPETIQEAQQEPYQPKGMSTPPGGYPESTEIGKPKDDFEPAIPKKPEYSQDDLLSYGWWTLSDEKVGRILGIASDKNLEAEEKASLSDLNRLSEKKAAEGLTPEERTDLNEAVRRYYAVTEEQDRRRNPQKPVEIPEIPAETTSEATEITPETEVPDDTGEVQETPEITPETPKTALETLKIEEEEPTGTGRKGVVRKKEGISKEDYDKFGATPLGIKENRARLDKTMFDPDFGMFEEGDEDNRPNNWERATNVFKNENSKLRDILVSKGFTELANEKFEASPYSFLVNTLQMYEDEKNRLRGQKELNPTETKMLEEAETITSELGYLAGRIKHAVLEAKETDRNAQSTNNANAKAQAEGEVKGTKGMTLDEAIRNQAYSNNLKVVKQVEAKIAESDAKINEMRENLKNGLNADGTQRYTPLTNQELKDQQVALNKLRNDNERKIRNGIDPETGARLPWSGAAESVTAEELADILKDVKFKQLSPQQQEGVLKAKDVLVQKLGEFMNKNPAVKNRLQLDYRPDDLVEFAIDEFKKPENKSKLTAEERDAIENGVMQFYRRVVTDALGDEFKRALDRSMQGGNIQDMGAILRPIGATAAAVQKQRNDFNKLVDSVDRSQITDEGIEKVMAVNDRYMTALMHAANADPGFNQINRGWGEAEGIKVLQNADRAESPRLRRLINEYYMDMTTAINQAVEAKKTEDALKAAQEAPQTPEQTQEVQQDQTTAETAQEPEEKPKHEKPKWGAGRKQNPGMPNLRGFTPNERTNPKLFDLGMKNANEKRVLPSEDMRAMEDDYYDIQNYGVPEKDALQIVNWFGRQAAEKYAEDPDSIVGYDPLWAMTDSVESDDKVVQNLGPRLAKVLGDYIREKSLNG